MLRLSLLFALFATTAHAEFVIESNHPALQPIAQLSGKIDTAGPILVLHRPCGTPNAFWDRQQTITICSELTDRAESKAQDALRHGRDRETVFSNSTGEILGVFFHELAHALIQRHNIAFTGREEDAADQFAAWSLIQINNPTIYIGAINFFAEPRKVFGTFSSNRSLTGEHGLNLQRRAQLVCWGYGKSPRLFDQLAAHIGITPDRLHRCRAEYESLMANTPRVFAAALR